MKKNDENKDRERIRDKEVDKEKEKEKDKEKDKDLKKLKNLNISCNNIMPKIFQIEHIGTDRIISNPPIIANSNRYFNIETYSISNPITIQLPSIALPLTKITMAVDQFTYYDFCVNEAFSQLISINCDTGIINHDGLYDRRYINDEINQSIYSNTVAIANVKYTPQTGNYDHKVWKYKSKPDTIRFYNVNLINVIMPPTSGFSLSFYMNNISNPTITDLITFQHKYYLNILVRMDDY